MFVRPAPGLKVRDPVLRDHLPAEGREVADSVYWQRRLRDRDVLPGRAAGGAPQAPAAKAEG